MESHFSRKSYADQFECETASPPYYDRYGLSILRRTKLAPTKNSGKQTYVNIVNTNRENYEKSQAKMASDVLADLKKQYKTMHLRQLMAVEILKNRVKSDLKRIVKQIDTQVAQGSDSKEFVVLGGGPQSLKYFTKKSKPHNKNRRSKSINKGFLIEVDVRGYIPNNVSVDTENNRMSIKATKVNGNEKALGIWAPSSKAMEKVKIIPPKDGVLILKYNSE